MSIPDKVYNLASKVVKTYSGDAAVDELKRRLAESSLDINYNPTENDSIIKVMLNLYLSFLQGLPYETALNRAVRQQNIEVARILIKSGADVNMVAVGVINRGCTPLHKAVRGDNLILIKLLLENGARTNAKNIHGDTLLHYAYKENKVSVVKLLLQYNGADPNIKNKEGKTALYYAEQEVRDNLEALSPPHVTPPGPPACHRCQCTDCIQRDNEALNSATEMRHDISALRNCVNTLKQDNTELKKKVLSLQQQARSPAVSVDDVSVTISTSNSFGVAHFPEEDQDKMYRILDNSSELERSMYTEPVIDYLFSRQMLTHEEKEGLEGQSRVRQARSLLRLMREEGPDFLAELRKALIRSHQQHLANLLQ